MSILFQAFVMNVFLLCLLYDDALEWELSALALLCASVHLCTDKDITDNPPTLIFHISNSFIFQFKKDNTSPPCCSLGMSRSNLKQSKQWRLNQTHPGHHFIYKMFHFHVFSSRIPQTDTCFYSDHHPHAGSDLKNFNCCTGSKLSNILE